MDIVEQLRDAADGQRFNPDLHYESASEIERLREALVAAKACINDKAYTASIMIIDTALQQKESE